MTLKRLFDLICVIPALLLLSPLLVLIALWIKLDTRSSILIKQPRIGQYGRVFQHFQFRTHRDEDLNATLGRRARMTHSGYYIHKYQLDGLPQLFNVLRGDMSLVGPQPEEPAYVQHYPDELKDYILSVPAGMTDSASQECPDEAQFLANSYKPEADYIEKILPIKLAYHQEYVAQQSLWLDLKLGVQALWHYLHTLFTTLFSLLRRVPIILHDLSMTTIAWAIAFFVRYPLPPDISTLELFWLNLPLVLGTQGLILAANSLFHGVWRFTSTPDFAAILRAALLGGLAILLVLMLSNRLEGVPRTSFLLYPLLLIFLLGMPRLLYRLWHEHSLHFLLDAEPRQRVLVLGAGVAGDMLVRDMLRGKERGYIPLAFLDDNPRIQGNKVQGIPVLGTIDKVVEIVEAFQIDLIFIAMPSANDLQMQRIVELCERCAVPFRTLPKLERIALGQVDLTDLREVAIDDLLGREKVQLDWEVIAAELTGKTVLVSGGGGSIGSELCLQIACLKPQQLIILERSEFNLYAIERKLRADFPKLSLIAQLGDIIDSNSVTYIFQHYQPQVVFHAAAYKHVPMLEGLVREAVRNNILGTHTIATTAVAQGCQTFVLISTDKAVNPTNVMGATKRASEMICQQLNAQHQTHFITVRFGNVLGSAGSVVPLFQEQIARGGPLTVTHPDITRYFMTIPEACQLILQAGAMGQGGEIYVLDMGKPIKIRYLAEQMIILSGKVPNRDIHLTYTGLRPGEKLHEELFHADEKLARTTHEKILLAAHGQALCERDAALNAHLVDLQAACNLYDEEKIQAVLQALVPEWQKGSE